MTPLQLQLNAAAPIYRQIADQLRLQIISGQLPYGRQLPPEEEFAAAYGINRATVRKGLKVLEAQNLLTSWRNRGTYVTYRPEERHCRIALVTRFRLNDFLTDAYAMKVMAVMTETVHRELNGELTMVPFCEDGDRQLKLIQQARCDGAVMVAPTPESARCCCARSFDQLPMVFLGASDAGLNQAGRITVDLKTDSMDIAVDYLYRRGHRRFGYIGTSQGTHHHQYRNRAIRQALERHGLGLDPKHCLINSARFSEWYAASRDFAAGLPGRPGAPTALICAGSLLTYAAWQGVYAAGFAIPEALSLIGYDCEAAFNPCLSSLEQPLADMGSLAGKLLAGWIRSGKPPREREYRFDIILNERGSTRVVADSP